MSDTKLIGKVYGIPPQPPVPENTTYFEAGAITIGVEYRDVNPDNLVETYKHNEEYLKELLEKSPEGGFFDEGVSIHVCGTEDGHEYLRFDVFDDEPHYHYIHKSDEVVNNVIDFDVHAHGEMLPWVISRLRNRLPEMLPHAKGEHLVPKLDQSKLDPVIEKVEKLATEAQAKFRKMRAARTGS
ncbi:MAG TPA: hypothetical protein VF183_05105 [Acidimicrobiales bacterium]